MLFKLSKRKEIKCYTLKLEDLTRREWRNKMILDYYTLARSVNHFLSANIGDTLDGGFVWKR